MATSLVSLLHQGNVGYCLEIVNSKDFGKKEVLSKYESALKKCLGNTSDARWETAITIAKLVRSGAWAAYHDETHALHDKWSEDNPSSSWKDNPYSPIGGAWWSDNSIYLLTFMKEKFGICRTSLYNYLEVVDEFTSYIKEKGKEPEYSISQEAKFFQFWQLIEMTSLTYQERKAIKPNWTRAEIRAYKKSLKEKGNTRIQPAEQVESEVKPLSEAQQRFAKYSKDDLINLILKLEKTCEESKVTFETILNEKKMTIENILARPVTAKNILPLKHELTGIIEKLLNSYNYEIRLNGRKQGLKAFSGVLAKDILESSSSENDDSSSPVVDGDPIQEKFAV